MRVKMICVDKCSWEVINYWFLCHHILYVQVRVVYFKFALIGEYEIFGKFPWSACIINTKLVKIAYLNVTDVKNNKWKPQNLVYWLLGGNLHIVIIHPHQRMPQNWSMADLYNEFGRLYYHDGFPNEGKLSCPIFTQDKYGYLEPLFDSEICLTTLRVDLVELMDIS